MCSFSAAGAVGKRTRLEAPLLFLMCAKCVQATAAAQQSPYPGVAQLVARLLWEQDAAGSNPVTRTMRSIIKGSEKFF